MHSHVVGLRLEVNLVYSGGGAFARLCKDKTQCFEHAAVVNNSQQKSMELQ